MFDFIDDLGVDQDTFLISLAASALFWVSLWIVTPNLGWTSWTQFPWYWRLSASILVVPLSYFLFDRILNK